MNFIHIPEFKHLTNHKKIEVGPLPKKAVFPLSQHTGAPSEPVVGIGDSVKRGSVIAKSKFSLAICTIASEIGSFSIGDMVMGNPAVHDLTRFRMSRFSDGSPMVPGPGL